MSTFKRCPEEVVRMANEVLCSDDAEGAFEALLDAKVTFDFVFARAGENEMQALTLHGARALGIARKTSPKDRALGRADCEVALDGDWWDDEKTNDQMRRALLDHELWHFLVVVEKDKVKKDGANRPVIEMRQHDFQFGWFKAVAQRHGEYSMERMQAKLILESGGAQLFWPEIMKP